MKSGKSCAVSVILAALLGGCASPYQQFYNGSPDARTAPGYIPQDGPVRVVAVSDVKDEALRLFRQGYTVFGQASFVAPTSNGSEDALRRQAEKVGAHLAIYSSSYNSTSSGVVPITTPTTSTAYTTANAAVYGSRGSAYATGNATTTTYGSVTNLVPFSVERLNFQAAFFIKTKMRLGVWTQYLTDAERKEAGTNVGVKVAAVADESPAFLADVLVGDVLLSIDGLPVSGDTSMTEALNKAQGRSVDVVLRRGGQSITKRVPIQNY